MSNFVYKHPHHSEDPLNDGIAVDNFFDFVEKS